jgi:quercetin dioxygenase-like cupin family protein
MTTLHLFRFTAALAAASLSILTTALVLAPDPAEPARPGEEKAPPLLQQVLKDVPGKQGKMITVDYAPGQESTPHVHLGSVFAYVLEGEVISQLAGGGEVKYRAGESWYEPPGSTHLVARNASPTKPARLLAVVITGEKDPVRRPFAKQLADSLLGS